MDIATENAQLPLPGALAPVGAAARLQALLATENKLLTKVAGAQGRLKKLIEKIDALQVRLQEQSAPYLARCLAADQQIHQMFERMLDPADRRLGKRAKKQVRGVYLDLQDCGPLSDRRSPADRQHPVDPSSDPFEGFDFGSFEAGPFSASEPRGLPEPDDGNQPMHKGRGREASRALFRKLADMLHPDKTPKELSTEERARREAAMKEASAAYGDGDLARLMWLEKSWALNQGPGPTHANALETRCEAVRKRIDELEMQADDLRYELGDLRHSIMGRAVADAKRVGIERVLDEMCTDLEHDQQTLENIVSFVADFRDGRVSLETFLAGPEPEPMDEDELEESFFDFLAEIANHIQSHPPASKPRGKKKPSGPRKKR